MRRKEHYYEEEQVTKIYDRLFSISNSTIPMNHYAKTYDIRKWNGCRRKKLSNNDENY